ncbi:putative low-temperature viability protein [Chaetomium strumarium]|uniref:Low-temperature viability protein n=1 Tax=Chaetomium strumarium TaxID=1170767 RepID=A0AAJ0M446_9PEZI|nr:putative low-temperature viability protein [Chaetomium strumarium]
MPKGKWIDKKTATHFTLVYRPQNDPLIHDESAPAMVLNPTQRPNKSKGKGLSDLASELGSDALSIRDNEGEAANYGIYYDDTEYDYMQHMRDLGQGSGEAVFIEADPVINKGKGKQKQSLEDALRQLDLQNQSEDLLDGEILPNKNLQRLTYQAQQDVPDAIAGFQPDMDPRLREVLEALEDEAYVDEEGGEDIFQELAKDAKDLGGELAPDEFEESYEDFEDDDGWESDRTVKATREHTKEDGGAPQLTDANEDKPVEGASEDWLEEFKKFKNDQKAGKKPRAAATPSELQSSIWTTTTNGGRRKTRKGALTNPSAYSMTSSSLVRTEQLGILDARFEKIEEEYNADMDDLGSVSAVSTMSTVQGPTRQDFDGMLDEFLNDYSMRGKKRVKKGKWKNGLQEFDEIRKELGPPIIPAKYR